MYIMSKGSVEKMVHEENCRYAKMIAAHNRVAFDTPEEGFAAGGTACIHCSVLMKKVSAEFRGLQRICEANGIDIIFDYSDGTLNIAAPRSEWKISTLGDGHALNLYHKNTANYDDGSSPYAGYHAQRIWYGTIRRHLEYIVAHDRYKAWEEERRRILI